MRRPPVDCDLDRVLDVASRAPTAIELNGSPWRLDLPPDLIPAARRRGIKFVVSADAHSTSELEYLRYAVIMARRGGLRRGDVLNTLSASELRRIAAVR
jgi:DNA polymerase (family 10)